MKKIVNMLIITLMALMTGFNSVEAASYPSNISVSSIGKLNYGGGIYFPVKYLSDGKLGYCTELYDNFPMGVAMSNPKKVNAGLTYIIDNGFKGTKADVNNSTKMRQYYVTQAAIYTYLGQANPSKSTTIGKEIWSVVDKAKQASEQTAKLSVTLNVTSTTMKLTSDKKYFISEAIAVKSNYSNVTFNTAVSSGVGASLVDANGKAITSVKSGSVVYIKVPESIIKAGQSVTLSMAVKGARTIKNAYIYQPGDSSYQNIIPGIVYPSQEAAEAKLSVKASKDKITTKVKISKQDITNKKELPGAKLVIKDSKGNTKASWTSTNVPVYVNGLTPGEYTLCETIAPAGYVLKTECIKFTVKADGSVTSVVMYNEPKKEEITTKVKISKQDITNKKELPGASLAIKDMNGKVIASWTSGTTPKMISGLKAGNYTLCETAAPAGYNLYTECIKFTVYADGSVSNVVMYNEPKKEEITTKVKISKQDITNKKELPGASLAIKDMNGKVIASWTSGTTPKMISGLKAGNYTLCETAAPAGYELETECIKFTVYVNGTVSTVIMYNKPKKEEITTKVKISKQDITNKKELPGASLAIKDMNGKVIASWTSGTTPKMISGLKAGNYTLCETAAPAGYVLKTECIKFTVKADGSVTSVVMYNEPKKVEIKKPVVSITKIDAETKKSLAGATLVLKNTKNEVIKTFTTTTKATVFTDIAAGTYTLEETKAPAGYNLSTKKVTVTLKNGQTTNVTFENTKKPVVPVKVTKVKISKQDITNNKELPGASLVIKDSKGNIVKSWVSTNEPAYFEGLNAGDYTLCETAAPAGYVLKTECIKFTVKADNTVKTVVMYNEPKKEEIVTKVQISKQDITTKKELPGASLVIKDANGKEIEKWVSTDKPKYIEGLKAGNYTLCETTAPAGYVLATECVNFTVKADGTITKVVIYNERKKEEIKRDKVKISKQDIATKSELPGATLVIKDATGKEIKRWVSTNEAFYFELEAGVYTLEEIIAPAGYILSTEKIEFTVNEDGSCDTEVIMFNTREVKVPITASNASILLYFTGFIGLFAGFIKINKNARI